MNKISFKELQNITSVVSFKNIVNDVFDYFRIVSLNKKEDELNAKNPLYFITYVTEEEAKDGWYINKIDLREYIDNIIKDNSGCTFVIDKTMVDRFNGKDCRYIVVDDLNETINDLFDYFKNKSHAKTIAITGSVGKTTCVGLLESVLKEKYNVWRIYSKRITPLILKANIINYLDDSVDYIVLENSIYYHDHVKILADLMKPMVSAILNIESSHLGVELLKTVDDICKYKSLIMQYSKKCYIIKGDEYLDRLHLETGRLYYDNEFILDNKDLELDRIDLERVQVKDLRFEIDNKVIIKPFMLSKLSQKQYAVVYYIASYLGLSSIEIRTGMEKYLPVENRVDKKIAFDKEIIFDGDITTYERMKELSDNLYDEKYLVLRKVGSAENTLRIRDIKDFFKRFKKVFIFEDVEYLEELKNEPNVIVVNNHDFMKNLEGVIIYHYSGYYRVWNEYNENNLKIYDREKYPIMKESK